ncbi:MAG TPA: succinate--CoA ligase subunit alpha [Sulfuricaulis sp.]|nr:succinate--CoA ligase subunit alpha [Sulfuricaulis sp.]
MSIFVNKSSRVVIQGLTGQHGSFHAEESIKIGTNVVAGVTPGKGGTKHLGIPLFDTVHEAVARTGADVAGIFVPSPFAADAIMEAIDTGIRTIVVVADGIPVQDMVRVKRYSAGRDVVIVGPNTPGLITPNECKVGIMPAHIYKPGKIGVVSRSGTLNYEAVEQMAEYKLGQSTCVGIGGDTVTGTDFLTVMRAFKDDPDTEAVVMIGEIGGSQEIEAAAWAKEHLGKPLVCFIAGITAPSRRRMGHAGAVIAGPADTAAAKMERIEALGAHVVRNPSKIGEAVHRAVQ